MMARAHHVASLRKRQRTALFPGGSGNAFPLRRKIKKSRPDQTETFAGGRRNVCTQFLAGKFVLCGLDYGIFMHVDFLVSGF